MAKVQTKTKARRNVTSYTNKAGVKFEEGTLVKLTSKAVQLHPLVVAQQSDVPHFAGRRITKSRVAYLFPDVNGLVRLDVRLGGFWSWDVDDLEKIQ